MRSARFAGEDATDAENLAKLRARGARRAAALRYVCAIAYVDPRRRRARRSRAAARARWPREPRGERRLRLRPGVRPRRRRRRPHDGRARATPRRTRSATAAAPPASCSAWLARADRRRRRRTSPRARSRAAAVSIASNTILIAAQGRRRRRSPARWRSSPRRCTRRSTCWRRLDRVLLRPPGRGAGRRRPPLRPREVRERSPRPIEGMLILVGSGGDRLRGGPPRSSTARELENLGIGIVVIGVRERRQPRRLELARSARARETESPALEGDAAHLRTDALHVDRRARRPRAGAASPARSGSTRSSRCVDRRARSSSPACGSSTGSLRVLVDEALPDDELEAIREAIEAFGAARRRRLPPAAHPPGRRAPLRRPARPVPPAARRSRTRTRPRTQLQDAIRGALAAPTC